MISELDLLLLHFHNVVLEQDILGVTVASGIDMGITHRNGQILGDHTLTVGQQVDQLDNVLVVLVVLEHLLDLVMTFGVGGRLGELGLLALEFFHHFYGQTDHVLFFLDLSFFLECLQGIAKAFGIGRRVSTSLGEGNGLDRLLAHEEHFTELFQNLFLDIVGALGSSRIRGRCALVLGDDGLGDRRRLECEGLFRHGPLTV